MSQSRLPLQGYFLIRHYVVLTLPPSKAEDHRGGPSLCVHFNDFLIQYCNKTLIRSGYHVLSLLCKTELILPSLSSSASVPELLWSEFWEPIFRC